MIIGYMFLYVHRPFEVWPALSVVRMELLYMLMLTAVWLASPKTLNLNRLTGVVVAFAVTMIFAWITSDYAEEGTVTLTNWLKLLPFYLMIITSVRDERDLKRLLVGFMFVMFLYMSHSLREFIAGRHVYRMGIARMVGVDQALSDPNSFAASIIYALPMILPIWAIRKNSKQTFAIFGYILLSVICVLLTGSRGGMIGLITFGAICLLSSHRRGTLILLLSIAIPVGWLALPEDIQNRYLTIIDDSRGPANAQESKDSRRLLFNKATQLWEESPLLGHGPGSFPQASGTKMQAHTLYGQVLAELGTIGAIVLLVMVTFMALNYVESRQLLHQFPAEEQAGNFYHLLIRSIFYTLILLLVLGFAGHNFYRFTWIWYAAFQGIALSLLRRQVEASQLAPASQASDELAPAAIGLKPHFTNAR
ncbi:MAG: O-antigen ligase family protein [Planctomycetaceae bacterium]